MQITTIGLDIAKNVFQVHAICAASLGLIPMNKHISGSQNRQPCLSRLNGGEYLALSA